MKYLDTCDTIYNFVWEGAIAKRFQPFWWSPVTALTDMCEVLRLLYSGYTNAEIADELVISINTVKKNTQNMYEKLAIGNRMELIQLIMEKTEKKV